MFLLTQLLCLWILGFLVSTAVMWATCRLLKVKEAKFVRCLWATAVEFLVLALVIVPLVYVYYEVTQFHNSMFVLLICVSWLCLPAVPIKFVLRIPYLRTVFVLFVVAIVSSILNTGIGYLVRTHSMEAYVLPAGSMAPALYGDHIRVECAHCRFEYSVNGSYLNNRPESARPVQTLAICPNCRLRSEIDEQARLLSGDRIIADKLSKNLRRWELAVFLTPENAISPHQSAGRTYVNRCVGLPGESIRIRQGDLFIDGQRLVKPHGVATDLWIDVHDTKKSLAHSTKESLKWQASDKQWKKNKDGSWTCDASGKEAADLTFSSRVSDYFSYNYVSDWRPDEDVSLPVRDIRLICTVGDFKGKGTLRFVRRFHNEVVTARVSPDGDVSIDVSRLSDKLDETKPIQSAKGKIPVRELLKSLEFTIRDGVAYLAAANQSIVQVTLAPDETIDEIQPIPTSATDRISIIAENCSLRLGRIQLARDTYYRSLAEMNPYQIDGDSENAVVLDDDEYFMLGDNSDFSNDSRFYGAVQKDGIIGTVRVRSWPPRRWRIFD